jgi:hypothetical protein
LKIRNDLPNFQHQVLTISRPYEMNNGPSR